MYDIVSSCWDEFLTGDFLAFINYSNHFKTITEGSTIRRLDVKRVLGHSHPVSRFKCDYFYTSVYGEISYFFHFVVSRVDTGKKRTTIIASPVSSSHKTFMVLSQENLSSSKFTQKKLKIYKTLKGSTAPPCAENAWLLPPIRIKTVIRRQQKEAFCVDEPELNIKLTIFYLLCSFICLHMWTNLSFSGDLPNGQEDWLAAALTASHPFLLSCFCIRPMTNGTKEPNHFSVWSGQLDSKCVHIILTQINQEFRK